MVVFSSIFVADTKIIFRYDFVAPLNLNSFSEYQFCLDLCFTLSNKFLYSLYAVSILVVLLFKYFFIGFLHPRTVKTFGFYLYFYFCEKFTINWKKCFKKCLYASFEFLYFFKTSPRSTWSLCLNVLIAFLSKLRLCTLWTFWPWWIDSSALKP